MKKNRIDMELAKIVHAGREAFENGLPCEPQGCRTEQETRLWVTGWEVARFIANNYVG